MAVVLTSWTCPTCGWVSSLTYPPYRADNKTPRVGPVCGRHHPVVDMVPSVTLGTIPA
jgi:hypothetical protein